MTTLPVLGLPDFSLPFDITTDASGIAIGAILSQQTHPLSFFSKKMCPRMQAASAYDHEMYAITESVKKWRHYLLGRHFRVYTDQKSLRGLVSQIIQTPSQQKWLTKLLGYDFEILYTPGRTNVVADALSRRPEPEPNTATLTAMTFCQPLLFKQLLHFYSSHLVGKHLMAKFCQSEPDASFSVKNGVLYYRDQLFIPEETNLRKSLIEEFHSSPVGGHSGVKGTLHRLAAVFSWPHMAQDVKLAVQTCSQCQASKYSTQRPLGLLQPLPVPQRIWEDITMDFITHLPPSQGKTTIWVIVDRLSKYSHFVSLPGQFSTATLAPIFIAEIFRLHGMPRSIISDRDRVFISKFWRELFRLCGTTLKFSSAYHPETDGQSEVTNRTLETYLRCFVSDAPKKWVLYLPLAEYWYNTKYHAALRLTPFEVVYGRSPPTLHDYLAGSTSVAALDESLINRENALQLIKENLMKAQSRMKTLADAHRQDRVFQVGDWVMLKLQPYRQVTLRGHQSPKLAPRYFGPYQVARVIGMVAYELVLPAGARIHPVFHISKLKPFHGPPPSQLSPIPPSIDSTRVHLQPSNIIGKRVVHTVNGTKEQLLVSWDTLPASEATWEHTLAFKESYPNYNLEDKVVLQGLGNDMHEGPKGHETIL